MNRRDCCCNSIFLNDHELTSQLLPMRRWLRLPQGECVERGRGRARAAMARAWVSSTATSGAEPERTTDDGPRPQRARIISLLSLRELFYSPSSTTALLSSAARRHGLAAASRCECWHILWLTYRHSGALRTAGPAQIWYVFIHLLHAPTK